MSLAGFLSTLRSSDHDFITALRFLDDYAKQVYERGRHHQAYHHFVPRFDLEQHGDTYQLYGELPGFRREDIIIEAHDDRNLQVSGSISNLTPQPPSSENKESKDIVNSSTKPQDENTTKEAPEEAPKEAPEEAPNGEIPKPTQESAPPAEVPQPTPDPLENTTTKHERYLNARFGDVLDPHAEFVHGQDDTEASPEAKDANPKVRYLISERHPCSFNRTFHFPTSIKKDEITATMQDGILHITAPRAPMPPPVKVPICYDIADYDAVVF